MVRLIFGLALEGDGTSGPMGVKTIVSHLNSRRIFTRDGGRWNQAVTPAMVTTFAKTARERMRIDGGGYRRDHLRALAQRVEVADGEVRIKGSKGDLLRTLAAVAGVTFATGRSSQF